MNTPGWPELTARKISRLCLCHTIFINFKVMYQKLKKCLNSRSSHQSYSIEKAVLKNFTIFTGTHLFWSLPSTDLRASRNTTFFKRDSNTGIFLWILQNFKNTYFDESLWTIASEGPASYCWYFFLSASFKLLIQ